ncbi:TolC family protein [Deinococcus sp. HMF7604]|uniref:TolC family protein n=1 Tax=Deinococcus betulae TaxID=2873312 RepID=UPI001CCFE263|nr:TolC family protein [Deinococcus betulae]MBZ9750217.1 TolC family protein [Deinococcus betulae]
MFRSRPLLLSLLLGTALSLEPARAQGSAPPSPPPPATAPQSGPLSLNDLLLALRTAPGWRAADLTYRAAQLTLQSARTRAGLSVSAGADGALNRVPWDGGEWKGSGTLTVIASLAVLPWSPAFEGVRSAERALAAAALTLRAERASLTAQLFQAYAGVRQAQSALTAAQAQTTLAARVLTITQAQQTQGLQTGAGVLERQAALEGAQAAEAQATRAVTQAQQAITRLLGTAVTLAPTSSLPDLTPAGDLPALLARALAQRPEVNRARAAVGDAQAGRAASALDARLPDLSAGVRAGQLADAQGNPGRTVSATLNVKAGVLGAQVSVPLRDTSAAVTGVALSLSASLPLLGRPQDTALAQAELGLAQAALALEAAQQGAELEVRTRFMALEDERSGLPAAQTRQAAAALAVQNARARLDAGLGTALDVAQAELNLLQADQALTAARDRITLAGLALAQSTADLDPLLLTLPPTPLPTGGRP